jgi:plasmid stabilization system protein ParE
MAFRVEISPEAFENLDTIAAYIQERGSFESAERWFNGIIAAVRTLQDMPRRCPLAEESTELDTEGHFLLHGKRNRRYKVYFSIHNESETVRVFHVRHWAKRPVEADELEDLMDQSADSRGEPEGLI